MSRRQERVAARLTAIQQEQAHALQAKIDQDNAKGRLRREHWEFAKAQYLEDGDVDRLRAEAQVFYNAEPFFSIQQAIVNVAVEVATLAAERVSGQRSTTPSPDCD